MVVAAYRYGDFFFVAAKGELVEMMWKKSKILVEQLLEQGSRTWCPRAPKGPEGPHRLPKVSSKKSRTQHRAKLKFYSVALPF